MFKVSPICTVVPDGCEMGSNGRPSSLKLSVLLNPVVITESKSDPYKNYVSGAPSSIDLERWPEAITALLSGRGAIRIHMRQQGQAWTERIARLSRHDRPSFAAQSALAQTTWERAFPERSDFEALHKVLTDESVDRSRRSVSAAGAEGKINDLVGRTYARMGQLMSAGNCGAADSETLGNYLTVLHTRELAQALLSDGNYDVVRDAREYARRMASILDANRTSAWQGTRQTDVLSDVRGRILAHLRNLAIVSNVLRTGNGDANPDERPTVNDLKAALLDVDTMLRTDWLEKAKGPKGLVSAPVAMQEYSTAYERRASSTNESEQTARRRLVGLRSQPTLAKLTRLLVDVEIDLHDSLGDALERRLDWHGEIVAEVLGDGPRAAPAPGGLSAGPYNLIPTRTKAHRRDGQIYFGPCSRYEWPSRIPLPRKRLLPLDSGFLHLRADPGRFYLRTFDTLLGTASSGTGAAQQEIAKVRGAESTGDRTPTLRSQGIQLGDSKADLEAAGDMIKALALYSGRLEPLYAEDLIMGFRVDIERTSLDPATQRKDITWSTATGRSLSYQGIDLPPRQAHLFPEFEERDDGFVAPLLRHDLVNKDTWTFARQELFSWTGDSLAIPAATDSDGQNGPADQRGQVQHGRRIAGLLPGRDLNIGVEYDFGPGSRSKLPALRLGDQYRFVLRACFANGGGPKFSPNGYHRLYDACALGESGLAGRTYERLQSNKQVDASTEWPFPFATPDPVASPSLALLANDPFVRAAQPEVTRPGEKFNQLVLRWERPEDRVARRVMLPPRIAFEQAEIQKQFDRIDDPQGALRSMRLDLVHGSLPHAADGSVTLEGKAGAHRGPVFEMTLMKRRKHSYFCDGRARCIVLSLQRPGSAPGEPGQEDVSLPLDDLCFWPRMEHPDRAMPILVEFRIARFGVTGARFAGPPEIREFESGGRFRALRVVVEVGLAEKIEVRAWCLDENLVVHNLLVQTLSGMKRSRTLGALNATLDGFHEKQSEPSWLAQTLWKAFARRPPTPLSDHLSWTVVAAVRRPLVPPRLEPVDGQVMTARRLRAAEAGKRWANTPRLPDEPDGTQLFIDGLVQVHRRSAGELRVQLLWGDFSDTVAVHKTQAGWVHKPRSHRLERSLSVPLTEENASKPISLDQEATDQSQPLTFGFNWQATRIGLRLISRSRFAHYYPSQAGVASDPSHFETENHPLEAFLKPGGEPDAERSYWLNATRRPPRPEVADIELVRHVEEVARAPLAVVSSCRWTVRLRLPRGSWHQSGEGELLAVVLLPESAVSTVRRPNPELRHRLDVEEFKLSDELRRLDMFLRQLFAQPDSPDATSIQKLIPLVSAWAADPTTAAGQLQPVLSPSQFAGWVEKRAKVSLPFIIDKKSVDTGEVEAVPAEVAIVAYEPLLDPETGERIVDIDFLSPDVDAPFVRLSVCRYQPRSLDGLWLSPQVLLDPFVLPSPRRMEVTWARKQVLRVKVTGPAYRRRTLGQVMPDIGDQEKTLQKEIAHAIDVPWIRMHVQRVQADGAAFLAADSSAQRLQADVPALVDGEQGVWEAEFSVPPGIRRFRVFAEEFELFTIPAEMDQRAERLDVPRGFKCEIDITDPHH